MKEADEIQFLKRDLERYFYIKEEVYGRHNEGFNLRIDALIGPKEHKEWRNGVKTVFGVEFKRDFNKIADRTKLLVQAIDYRHCRFPTKHGALYLPIFVYPNPILDIEDRHFYDRFLGRLNIGFLEYKDNYRGGQKLALTLSGHEIWDSETGVRTVAKKMQFKRKIGSQ